jgi:NitT/TauT family transport system substrate-binding protein
MRDCTIRRSTLLSGAATSAVAWAAGVRPRAGAASLTPLRIGIAPSDGVTSVVYAAKTGIFEKAGFDVHLDTQSNGAAVAAAVMSGFFSFGNTSITSVLQAHDRGLPLVLVAPAGVYNSKIASSGAIVPASSGHELGRDANDQTISVASLSGIGHYAFSSWIQEHGGDWQTVKFIEVPLSAAQAAVMQGRVIAAEIANPALAAAMMTGKFNFVPINSSIASRFIVSCWFTTRDFSSKYPQIVKAFARVVATTATWANKHQSRTAPVMADFTGIPLASFEHMTRQEQGTVLIPALIQPVIDACLKYGAVQKSFPATEVIDPNVLRP